MKKELLNSIAERLQKERRILVNEAARTEEALNATTGERESELQENAQQQRDSLILEQLDERQQRRIADIDAALARIEAGTYGVCARCGAAIEEDRLLASPTTTLCAACSPAATSEREQTIEPEEEAPQSGRLPPDLEQLDDQELQAHLMELLKEDGTIDPDELQIQVRQGIVYLEGAVPSESQHEVLRNILTDVAGVEEIVDHIEVERLAWEREDRSKEESAQDVLPGTIPDQEPYGGTEDVVLSKEEGLPFEPPLSPPPPPHRKD